MPKTTLIRKYIRLIGIFISVLFVFFIGFTQNVFNVRAQAETILKQLALGKNETGDVSCSGKMSFSWDPSSPNNLKVLCGGEVLAETDTSNSTNNSQDTQNGGLTAKYYNNKDFSDLALTRIDKTVDFSWDTAAPDSLVDGDTFSVEWSGKIIIPEGGEYTFYMYSDDGIKLYINNQIVVENWTDHSPREDSGKITLSKGEYPIYIQFYENHGQAYSRMLWSSSGISKQVVPSSNLIPDEGDVLGNNDNNSTSGQIELGGLGVGSGDGLEVGMNMAKFNDLKTRAANGEFDRPCTEAEHDPTVWHPLVNEEAGCHYDHQHGDDPNYVNDIFGEPGAWFGQPGQSISYPWQTFPLTDELDSPDNHPDSLENVKKHEGYNWVVRRDQNCPDTGYCIKDFRLQFHGMFMAKGAAVRYHSFSAEMRLCKDGNDLSTCGIYRTGGWQDHGPLVVVPQDSDCWASTQEKYDEVHIPLAADGNFSRDFGELQDELRCHKNLSDSIINSGPSFDKPYAEWWTNGSTDFRYVVKVFDPIGPVEETSPGSGEIKPLFFCDEANTNCRWNQSMFTADLGYVTKIWNLYGGVEVDENKDGKTDLTLGKVYIDRHGDANHDCSAPGYNCIPLEINNIWLNQPEFGQGAYNLTNCPSGCNRVDHDITPAGKPSWITWFYNH